MGNRSLDFQPKITCSARNKIKGVARVPARFVGAFAPASSKIIRISKCSHCSWLSFNRRDRSEWCNWRHQEGSFYCMDDGRKEVRKSWGNPGRLKNGGLVDLQHQDPGNKSNSAAILNKTTGRWNWADRWQFRRRVIERKEISVVFKSVTLFLLLSLSFFRVTKEKWRSKGDMVRWNLMSQNSWQKQSDFFR